MMLLSSVEWLLQQGWTLIVFQMPDARFLARIAKTTPTENTSLSETAESLQAAVGRLMERVEE